MSDAAERESTDEHIKHNIRKILEARSDKEREAQLRRTVDLLQGAYRQYIRTTISNLIWIQSDVDDVCQEAFATAYIKLGAAPDEWLKSPRAYITQIAIYKALQWRRDAAVKASRFVPMDETITPAQENFENAIITNAAFEQCLKSLSPALQNAIKLVRLGYDSDQIKCMLDISQDTYNQRVKRARDLLKPCMKQKGIGVA